MKMQNCTNEVAKLRKLQGRKTKSHGSYRAKRKPNSPLVKGYVP